MRLSFIKFFVLCILTLFYLHCEMTEEEVKAICNDSLYVLGGLKKEDDESEIEFQERQNSILFVYLACMEDAKNHRKQISVF
ncbi:hypothetical protein P3G55_20565 [Leptospira sp. 96542]|nr:hypothetical protein [Leptospira sp. 96542]